MIELRFFNKKYKRIKADELRLLLDKEYEKYLEIAVERALDYYRSPMRDVECFIRFLKRVFVSGIKNLGIFINNFGKAIEDGFIKVRQIASSFAGCLFNKVQSITTSLIKELKKWNSNFKMFD